MKSCKLIAVLLLCCMAVIDTFGAPRNGTATIRGKVTDKNSGKPVEFAFVVLSPSQTYTTTNEKGEYMLEKVDAGASTISIIYTGMETEKRDIEIRDREDYVLDFQLTETNFRLKTVTVVATQNQSGSSTASNISRQAMDHMQTSSLSDLMAFLPGVALSNPDLSTASQFNIRTAFDGSGGGSAYGQGLNSLGTSIIVDGAPVSANSNMQILSPAITGATGSTQSGVDARGISTDNIESVEVIRGVPSAEYGDLTSGAVIVHSKAGREPVSIRLKANPYTYQAAASGGFSLGEKAGILNITSDYAYNNALLYENYYYYQRLNLKAVWSKTFAEALRTTTSLDFGLHKDTREMNPNDLSNKIAEDGNEQSIRFNTNGDWNINSGWLKSISYTLSFSYSDKYNYYQQYLSGAPDFYSAALTDGAAFSNIPGVDVFDKDGRKMTLIPASEADKTMQIVNNYLSKYEIFGKELNGYARVKADFNKKWGDINNHILVGADFKSDGNLGQGKVYDDATPPGQMSAYELYSSYRRRPYSDIPFINQIGIYGEDTYRHLLGGTHELNVKIGARYDNINGKSVISPRINSSIDIIPEVLTLRAAWGQNAKAPTSMYLYPEKAYFNIGNYNGGDGTLVGTVRVFDTENPDLEIATLQRAELGLDLKLFGRYRLSLTGFNDRMDNGYAFGKGLSSYHLVQYDRYLPADNGSGSVVPSYDGTYSIFLGCNSPFNRIKTLNRGIEYELDLGRFDAIRTSFYINGAYIQSRHTDMGPSFVKDVNTASISRDIVMYEGGRYTSAKDKLLTTLRVTHNIPEIGFVVTVVAQVNWMEKYWTESNVEDDTKISKWLSYADGKVHDFDYSLVDTPEYKYLKGASFADNRFIAESYFPTAFFNINISKEIGDKLTASFFANNFTNFRPQYKSKADPSTTFLLLGDNSLFFGFDLKFNIK